MDWVIKNLPHRSYILLWICDPLLGSRQLYPINYHSANVIFKYMKYAHLTGSGGRFCVGDRFLWLACCQKEHPISRNC